MLHWGWGVGREGVQTDKMSHFTKLCLKSSLGHSKPMGYLHTFSHFGMSRWACSQMSTLSDVHALGLCMLSDVCTLRWKVSHSLVHILYYTLVAFNQQPHRLTDGQTFDFLEHLSELKIHNIFCYICSNFILKASPIFLLFLCYPFQNHYLIS